MDGAIGAMLQTGALIRDLSVRELLDDDGVAVSRTRCRSTRCSTLVGIGTIADAPHRRSSPAARPSASASPSRSSATPTCSCSTSPRWPWTSRAGTRSGRRCAASPPRGKTIVFATHYLEEADANADRAVLMAHGSIVADGPTDRDQGDGRPAHDPRDAPRTSTSPSSSACPASARPSGAARRSCCTAATPMRAIRALLQTLSGRRATSRSPAPGLEQAFLQLTGVRRRRRDHLHEIRAPAHVPQPPLLPLLARVSAGALLRHRRRQPQRPRTSPAAASRRRCTT